MQSIGKVAMDLVFNEKQYNTELSKMMGNISNKLNGFSNKLSKVKNLALAAFSVVAVRNFANACEDAYEAQIESERKLLTVMSKRENATKQSVQDILDLASAQEKLGVVSKSVQLAGAQELSTYIEQSNSIKKLLPIMNNMLAQQYGYNATAQEAQNIATMMGKVLDGQTGALSRYGYYFDENQEKILKFGNEEQRVAVLTKIVSDSIGDVNEALGSTPIGRQIQLANAWANVRAEIGYLIAQIKQVFIPVLNVLVNVLGRVVGYLRQFFQALGITSKAQNLTGSSLKKNSSNIDDYAKSLGNATDNAKKLKKAVSSIDELTIVSTKDSSSSSGSNSSDIGSGGIGGTNDIDFNMGIDGDVEVSNKIQKIADKARTAFSVIKDHLATLFVPLKNAWDTYGSSVLDSFKDRWSSTFDFMKTLYKSFESVWTNGTGEKFVGNILQSVKTINTINANIYKSITKIFEKTGLGEKIIQHIFDILNSGIEIVNTIGSYFEQITMSEAFQSAVESVGEIINLILENVSKIFDVVKKWVMSEKFQKALTVVTNVVSDLLGYVKDIMSFATEMYEKYLYPVLSNVFDLISDIIIVIGDVWNALKPVIDFVWDALKKVIEPVFSSLMDSFNSVINVLKGILEFLSGIFTLDWDKAWDGIKNTVSSVWDFIKGIFSKGGKIFDGIVGAIGDVFKTVVNAIISGINKIIAVPFNVINKLLNKIKEVDILGITPFWSFWGYNPLPVPQIPKLARGGWVDKNNPQLAIIGDNTREGEIVSPESKIYEQVAKAIKDTSEKGLKQEIEMTIYHKYEDGRTIIQKINQAEIDAGKILLLT